MSDYRFRVEGRESGTFDLPGGSETGTVAETWDSAPTLVKLTVEAPDGSVVFATLDGDTRDDGFDFTLSAAPETDGFKLHWICDF